MKNASENQESNGMLSENLSPGSKVKDFSPHPNPSFPKETPMKPSKITNCYPPHLSYLGKIQPLLNPLWHHRPHSHHSPQSPGHHSHHPYHQRNRKNNHHGAAHRRPASPPHPQNPYGSHYQDSPSKRDQREKVPVGPERKDHTGQDINNSNTVESSLVLPTPLVKLHKPLEQPPLSGSGREPTPLQCSHSWSHSSGLKQAHIQDQSRRATFPPAGSTLVKSTLLSEDDPHHLRQKRCRESSTDDDNAKKQCLKLTGPDGPLQRPTSHDLSPHFSSQKQSRGPELSPKASDNHLRTESAYLSTPNPVHSASHGCKSCLRRTPMGAKQACIQSMQNNIVVLLSPPRRSEALAKADEEPERICKPKSVSFSDLNTPNDPRSSGRPNQGVDNKTVDSLSQKLVAKQSTTPSSCRKLHRNKKPVIVDDIQDLFRPDPTTYIVNSRHKILKVKPDDKTSSSLSISSNPPTPGPEICYNEKTAKIPKISLPSIILTRVQLPTTTTRTRKVKQESVQKAALVSPPRTDEQSEEKGDEDPIDLDLELDFNLDLEVRSIRSSDSEDEPLVSLQEIMTKKDKPNKEVPEKGAVAGSRSPGHGQHNRTHHTVSSTKTSNYKNSLDQILKELNTSKKAKETETELLTACQEDLLRIAEYEEAESREEPISAEQQQFLQQFSLTSSAIRDVPPGHDIFNLEKFGRIFNQNTLQLRQCTVNPQNTEQKTLLWSSHAQFKSYIHYGLFQAAYGNLPCPFQVTCFLFKMMSVHTDRLLSGEILQILTDIAYTAAVQRVNRGNEKFRVWVPSLEDITLALMNMGASFVSLFPLESLQPPFTEGDLLKTVYIKSESPSNQGPRTFPEHNCVYIYKYLKYCLDLCPRFYSDCELLLLLTLLCTVSLESRLLLQTTVAVYPLLYKLLQNIRRWDDMLPKICQALTDLTDDHHNMCHLAKLLPHHTRGMKLRQHLSLSMISKLLDGSCLYTPKSREIQLCDLRPYLHRMKPSSLLQTITSSSHRSHSEGEEDSAPLDQQVYYLCYSLLTLTNEATNFDVFPINQKEQLLLLCSELERHVKCHIREGEKWLYRSKVKDLVARIYTKWQMMLQKTKPLNGKLYDYWQPLQGEAGGSQDIEEIESSQEAVGKDGDDDEEEARTKMEDGEEEEEVSETEVMHKENEGTVHTLKEASLSNEMQEGGMDFSDGAPEQVDVKDADEGRFAEQKTDGTFERDSEGGTNMQDVPCEDMETDGAAPSVESLSQRRLTLAGDGTFPLSLASTS